MPTSDNDELGPDGWEHSAKSEKRGELADVMISERSSTHNVMKMNWMAQSDPRESGTETDFVRATAADIAVHSRVAKFTQERQRHFENWFISMVKPALAMAAVGTAVYMFGGVLYRSRNQGFARDAGYSALLFHAGWIVSLLGSAIAVSGVVVAFVSPNGVVDLNVAMCNSVKSRTVVLGSMVLYSAVCAAKEDAQLYAVAALVALFGLAFPLIIQPTTTMCTSCLLNTIVGSTGLLVWQALDLGSGWPQFLLFALAFVQCASALVLCRVLIFHHWRYAEHIADHGANKEQPYMSPTACLYVVLYFSLLFEFLATAGLGVAMVHERKPDGWYKVAHGSTYVLPLIVLYVVGFDHLFELLSDHFQRNYAELDGAFVAEMLYYDGHEIGDTWWCHRDEPNLAYGEDEFERNWDKGTIVSIDHAAKTMVVGLLDTEEGVEGMALPTKRDTGSKRIRVSGATRTRDANKLKAMGLKGSLGKFKSTLKFFGATNLQMVSGSIKFGNGSFRFPAFGSIAKSQRHSRDSQHDNASSAGPLFGSQAPGTKDSSGRVVQVAAKDQFGDTAGGALTKSSGGRLMNSTQMVGSSLPTIQSDSALSSGHMALDTLAVSQRPGQPVEVGTHAKARKSTLLRNRDAKELPFPLTIELQKAAARKHVLNANTSSRSTTMTSSLGARSLGRMPTLQSLFSAKPLVRAATDSVAVTKGKQQAKAQKVHPKQRTRVVKRGEDMDSRELLEMAKKNLRCIDWSTLTYELMASSPLNSKTNFYEYSRELEEGETEIDYFVSHSWHDDLDTKWAALTQLVEEFKDANGREPTFWLDKVCIDQDNISDGLRVLPVNIMACKSMLVLCGTTYVRRLWCAWELFTLFAFQDKKAAISKITLVPLVDKKSESVALSLELSSDQSRNTEKQAEAEMEHVLEMLLEFDVDLCRMYDPNEESKVRRVIAAVGEEQFNERMQNLERDIFEHRNNTENPNGVRAGRIRKRIYDRVSRSLSRGLTRGESQHVSRSRP